MPKIIDYVALVRSPWWDWLPTMRVVVDRFRVQDVDTKSVFSRNHWQPDIYDHDTQLCMRKLARRGWDEPTLSVKEEEISLYYCSKFVRWVIMRDTEEHGAEYLWLNPYSEGEPYAWVATAAKSTLFESCGEALAAAIITAPETPLH